MTRCNVVTVNTDALSLTEEMQNVSRQKLQAMKNKIADAINERREKDAEAAKSKDFAKLEEWNNSENLPRLFAVLNVDPYVYIMQRFMTDAELEKKGFSPVARTRNLKAYKKVREIAEYIATGNAKLEDVMKTFVACTIHASQNTEVIQRNVCKRFLNSLPMDDLSSDLTEALEKFRAKHMSGGAETQSAQCMLTLCNLGAGEMVQDGKNKNFRPDVNSPVMQAFAARFGMTEVIQKAIEKRAETEETETA